MTDRICIKYQQDQAPVAVLKAAMRQHGDGPAFILVPAALWRRLVPKGKRH
ncbi:MAG: hypothetical protein HGJ94_07790 [Desulfosarcina sp.]|nr:hypothetical protein [Desulfosarcina sp.]